MNYDETLEKIHSFSIFGSKLGLHRMKILLELLGNPHEKLKIIHVAGTNGKGSVCRYVYSVLQANGYHAGAYFSPYIERFTERIEFDGHEIPKDALIKYAAMIFEAVDKMISLGAESPTEFEIVTAIGFCYFAAENADFVVLEVGLGGRGDSTNVCEAPYVTAITSISFDHMDRLGDTLEKIAAEKAGILKQDVPMVVNVDDEAAFEVIRQMAAEKNSPIVDVRKSSAEILKESLEGFEFSAYLEPFDYELGLKQSYICEKVVQQAAVSREVASASSMTAKDAEGDKLASASSMTAEWAEGDKLASASSMTAKDAECKMDKDEDCDTAKSLVCGKFYDRVKLSMTGTHQVQNAMCALNIIEVLRARGVKLDDKKIMQGMTSAVQKARFEVMRREPSYLILDGAHNEAGIEALTDTVLRFFKGKKILLCTGILADKSFDIMARELMKLEADIIVTEVPNPRRLEAEMLADVFRKARMDYEKEQACIDYEKEQACMDYEKEQACLDYEKEQACIDYEKEQACLDYEKEQACIDYRKEQTKCDISSAAENACGVHSITVVPDYKKAADAAIERKNDYDLVLWAGSLYLIGAVRKYIQEVFL